MVPSFFLKTAPYTRCTNTPVSRWCSLKCFRIFACTNKHLHWRYTRGPVSSVSFCTFSLLMFVNVKDKKWCLILNPDSLIPRGWVSFVCTSLCNFLSCELSGPVCCSLLNFLMDYWPLSMLHCRAFDMSCKYFLHFLIILWLYLGNISLSVAWRCSYLFCIDPGLFCKIPSIHWGYF